MSAKCQKRHQLAQFYSALMFAALTRATTSRSLLFGTRLAPVVSADLEWRFLGLIRLIALGL